MKGKIASLHELMECHRCLHTSKEIRFVPYENTKGAKWVIVQCSDCAATWKLEESGVVILRENQA